MPRNLLIRIAITAICSFPAAPHTTKPQRPSFSAPTHSPTTTSNFRQNILPVPCYPTSHAVLLSCYCHVGLPCSISAHCPSFIMSPPFQPASRLIFLMLLILGTFRWREMPGVSLIRATSIHPGPSGPISAEVIGPSYGSRGRPRPSQLAKVRLAGKRRGPYAERCGKAEL